MPITAQQRLQLQHRLPQMLILGFDGEDLSNNSSVVQALAQALGGIILFDYDYAHKLKTGERRDKNIINPQQVRDLNRQVTEKNGFTYRSVDHEGGVDIVVAPGQARQGVSRLKPTRGFAATLSAKQIGELFELTESQGKQQGDTPQKARQRAIEAIRKHAAQNAVMLSELGFNLVYAPCVDVHEDTCPIIGAINRAYSNNIETVIACARVQLEEYQKVSIQCVLKHYPGHGRSSSDSHLGITDITQSWRAEELDVYKALANQCGMVMMAHVFNNNIDATFPASISEQHIKMLRQECHFDGVIMVDDIQMDGLEHVLKNQYKNELAVLSPTDQENFIFEKIIEQGIKAGADMFIIGNQLKSKDPNEILEKFVATTISLAERGNITVDAINESYRRIIDRKSKFFDNTNSTPLRC